MLYVNYILLKLEKKWTSDFWVGTCGSLSQKHLESVDLFKK